MTTNTIQSLAERMLSDYPKDTAWLCLKAQNGTLLHWFIGASSAQDNEASLMAHAAEHRPSHTLIAWAIK